MFFQEGVTNTQLENMYLRTIPGTSLEVLLAVLWNNEGNRFRPIKLRIITLDFATDGQPQNLAIELRKVLWRLRGLGA